MEHDTTGNFPESMADAWQTHFDVSLAPLELSPDSAQYIETRRTFYAGANIMLSMIVRFSDTLTQDESTRAIDAIGQELTQFREELQRGEA